MRILNAVTAIYPGTTLEDLADFSVEAMMKMCAFFMEWESHTYPLDAGYKKLYRRPEGDEEFPYAAWFHYTKQDVEYLAAYDDIDTTFVDSPVTELAEEVVGKIKAFESSGEATSIDWIFDI